MALNSQDGLSSASAYPNAWEGGVRVRDKKVGYTFFVNRSTK